MRAAEKGIEDELKWAEPSTRTEAGAWGTLFRALRRKRLTVVREAMEARPAAGNIPAMVVGLDRFLRCKRRVRLGQLHVHTPTSERLHQNWI